MLGGEGGASRERSKPVEYCENTHLANPAARSMRVKVGPSSKTSRREKLETSEASLSKMKSKSEKAMAMM